jgi:ElaB/YqjD/DUF883 family membrane-anchored ribosome-binding protein
MAEKTGELRKDEGILSETDKDIISTVASNSDGEFVEKYTDETSESDEPEQIRSQIEQTRREMGETIDEIQERLSYENISEQVSERVNEAFDAAKASAYKATVGKAEIFMKNAGRELKNMGREISKTQAGKTVLSNPVPFALIGLGAGVLLFNAFGKKKSSRSGNGRDYDYDYDDSPSMLKSAGDKVSDTYDSLGKTTNKAYENVSGFAGRAYESVTHAADSAYHSVNDAAHQAYEKAGELGQQARQQYDYYIEENPLVVGAVALAAGAAVGLAIPSTRYESRLLGGARDQFMQKANQQVKGLVQKAEETAKEQIDKVKTVAEETTKTAQTEAENQGLAH